MTITQSALEVDEAQPGSCCCGPQDQISDEETPAEQPEDLTVLADRESRDETVSSCCSA